MKKHKRDLIILDCDDVLLDYVDGFIKFVKFHYNIVPNGRPTDYTWGEWLNCDQVEAYSMIKHFNENAYEFGLLKPVEESTVMLLNSLYEIHKDKVDFIVVTKSGTRGHGEVLRKVNLYNVFGDIFSDIIILEHNETKTNAFKKLEKLYNIVTVVDDFVGNIDDAKSLGLDAVMLARSHNENLSNSTEYNRANNWNELFIYINNKIGE